MAGLGKHKTTIYNIVNSVYPQLFLLVLVAAVVYPLMEGQGMPSYRTGRFHSATIAYYIEWARELEAYGFFTPAWCGGFDLLRFYPPLGLMLLYSLGKIAGSYAYAAQISFMISIYVFVLAVYALFRELTGSRIIGIVMSLTALSIEGYVSTISVYWEYTRILGEGLAFNSLAYLYRAMREGSRRDAILAGIYGGATLLTHPIASLVLASLSIVTLLYWIYVHYQRGAELGVFIYTTRIALISFFLALAISGWWLLPALAPYGLSHYMRVTGGSSLIEKLLYDSIHVLQPPLYEPAIQLPLLILGIAGIILQALKGGNRLILLYVATILFLVAIYGQGSRLFPVLGLFMLASLSALNLVGTKLDRRTRAKAIVPIVLLALVSTAYIAFYLPAYHEGLTTDNTYVNSDEFLIANYLAERTPEGYRVYAMYGPKLHGNQWLNVFAPRLWQVNSGFEEGCIRREPMIIDYLIKNTLETARISEMLDKFNVAYIAADKEWYESTGPNSLIHLESRGIIEKDPLSKYLHYSILFRVTTVEGNPPDDWSPPSLMEYIFMPSRLLGIAMSIFAAYCFARVDRSVRE